MDRNFALGVFLIVLLMSFLLYLNYTYKESFLPSVEAIPSPSVGINKNCGDFRTQKEAQSYFDNNGKPKSLDKDLDGIACETLQ